MIESRYWRDELRKDISWLRRKRIYKRYSEKQLVLFERKLMLVSFQIRSLLDRPIVLAKYAKLKLQVKRYGNYGEKVLTKMNMDVYEIFDLDKPILQKLSAPQVCNQLIHHYLMIARSDTPRNFTTLWVVSDYKHKECLFEIDISALIDYFAKFSIEASSLAQFGSSFHLQWNEKIGDYVFHSETG